MTHERMTSCSLVTLLVLISSLISPKGCCQSLTHRDTLVREITECNDRLSAVMHTNGASVIPILLNQRAGYVASLMAIDPSEVLKVQLSQETIKELRNIDPSAQIESEGQWSGKLEATVADDFEHDRSFIRWYLKTIGRRLQLHFIHHQIHKPGSSVTVTGISVLDHVAVITIRSLEDSVSTQGNENCSPIGPQNIAVLMITMPNSPTAVQDRTDP